MILDLAGCADDQTANADVCIIGGGIAGLIAADRLRRRGRAVVVLESGGRGDAGGEHPLNTVAIRGQPYHGAAQGRARGLGGTSSRWGGALIPFLEQDFKARPHLGVADWPIGLSDLAPYVPEVERLFGVDASSFEADFLDWGQTPSVLSRKDSMFLLRYAKWPSFRRRNVATLLRDRLERDAGLSVWLNATAVAFDVDSSAGRLSAVTANALGGRSVRVTAGSFVVAAGAIESTRLLLLLHRQSGGSAFQGCSVLGRGFHDHVSLPAASITAVQPRELNRLAGFRFHKGTMRSLRFEFSPEAQTTEGVSSSFGHITFETVRPSGFEALRDCLRTLQKTGRLNPAKALAVAGDLPYLTAAAWWRYVNGQLLWPQPARYRLTIVGEQVPRDHNRIDLADAPDALGVPRAAITWTTGEQEMAAITAFARCFDAYWERYGHVRIGTLNWLIDRSGRSQPLHVRAEDVFHPGGTTRMGASKTASVVNAEFLCHTVGNLWVVSTSIFPTGASANPTLMLMTCALRLADRIV